MLKCSENTKLYQWKKCFWITGTLKWTSVIWSATLFVEVFTEWEEDCDCCLSVQVGSLDCHHSNTFDIRLKLSVQDFHWKKEGNKAECIPHECFTVAEHQQVPWWGGKSRDFGTVKTPASRLLWCHMSYIAK